MCQKKCAVSAELLFCRRRRPQRSMLDDSRIFGKDVSAHARVSKPQSLIFIYFFMISILFVPIKGVYNHLLNADTMCLY